MYWHLPSNMSEYFRQPYPAGLWRVKFKIKYIRIDFIHYYIYYSLFIYNVLKLETCKPLSIIAALAISYNS